MELLQILERYAPFNEQEARDRAVLMGLLRTGQDLWTRENEAAHLTASAWVVNGDRERVLMAHHNIPGPGWADMRTESGICWPWRCGRYGKRADWPGWRRCRRRSFPWKS